MIISKRISIYRVVSGTWINLILIFVTCCSTYLLYKFIPINVEVPTLIPTILGTALAFFIGFNNNQAYDRWWEARKIWGALVNDSRSWARQLIYFQHVDIDKEDIDAKTKTNIYRHIAFIYALKQSLRKSNEDEYKKYISEDDIAFIDSESNKTNALLSLQTRDLNQLYSNNSIDGFKFIELNKLLYNFCNEMGKSERISNTIFPPTYNFYTRMFVWLLIVIITLVTAQTIGFWSIFAGTLVGYVFLTINKIGQSLLNPFEDIATGIPLNQITRTIEINMLQVLRENEIPKPIESVRGGYIM